MTKLMRCDYCGREYMRSDTPERNRTKHKFCSIQCRIEGLRGIDYKWLNKSGDIRQIKEFMKWK